MGIEEKKYFAFISYKREDEEWAIWLQHELEYYHLPSSLNGRREELGIPKEFRPVFRDIDELKAGKLSEQISDALGNSTNLIVVCSPQCANNPEWVNKEIEEFVRLGRGRVEADGKDVDITGHIFPFIVEGTPHSKDDRSKECFPSALIALSKNNDLLGGNVNETGRDKAFIKVLAGMLPKVAFDDLWDRYGKDKAEEERKAREQRDNLLRLKSRFISEKANGLFKDGDSYTARKLLLEVLPSEEEPDIPITTEAEMLLRDVVKHNCAVFSVHDEGINSVSFSPDGKTIVSACADKTIRLWDVATGRQIGSPFCGHTKEVNSASYSSDGKLIVSCSDDNSIRIWDATSGKQIGEALVANTKDSLDTCYKPYIIDDSGFIIANKEKKGKGKGNDDKAEDNHTDSVASVQSASFSPDGKRIVSASGNVIRIWDVATRKQIGERIVGHTDTVNSVLYNFDGTLIVSASDDMTIRIWDPSTGKQRGESLIGHTSEVLYASFSPDGKKIISASWDGFIKIWDYAKGIQKKIRHPLADYVEYSRDGRYILSVGGGIVRLFEVSTKKKIKEVFGDVASISVDGAYLVSSDNERGIILSELPLKDSLRLVLENHCKEAYYATYSTNGEIIASVSSDGRVKIWEADTGALIYESPRIQTWHLSRLSFSPCGKMLLISSLGTSVNLWDLNSAIIKSPYVHSASVTSAVFSPDGSIIVSASMDGVIKIWDYFSGKQVGEPMNAFTYKSYADVYVAYSPDGSQFLSAARDGTIKIWDPKTCKQIGDSIEGYAANYSRDGKLLVTANNDTIIIWDVIKRVVVREFTNSRRESISFVSFSPDGKYLLCGSPSEEICILDLASGGIIEHIPAPIHDNRIIYGIKSLSFSPRGRSILSVSHDGAIKIWGFPSLEDLIEMTRVRFKECPLSEIEKKRYYLE